MFKLIKEKNNCIDSCEKDEKYNYEYNNICYDECPTGTNQKNYICINDEYKMDEDKNMDKFRENIFDDEILEKILDNKEDLVQKGNNITYQITTSDNQKNNQNNNISTINLGDCENILKEKYKINESLPLLIFKIDYYPPDTLIPIVGYEVYHPINKSKLNLDFCENAIINLNVPASVDENNLFKYNPNSDFYNDNCNSYTTDNGTDILLNDRKKEFNNNNLSLCQNKCEYIGYNKDNKQSTCNCTIKNEMNYISDIVDDPNKLSTKFEIDEESSSFGSSGVKTIKCTKALFSKNGLISNISSYILFIFIFTFLLSILLFIKCGYHLLQNDIKAILDFKKKNDKLKNNSQITTSNTRKNKNIKKRNFNSINNIINFPPRKNQRKVVNLINNFSNIHFVQNKAHNKNNNNNINKSRALRNNNKNSMNLKKKNGKKINKNNNTNIRLLSKNNKKIGNVKLYFNDYELNSFKYSEAKLHDKRGCCGYYNSLIKRKQPLIFAFCPVKDYNLMVIKLCIFCLSFSIYYFVNFFFFDEKMIHKIYEKGGKYDILFFLPKISIAFAICYFLTVIIKLIFLSERNILQVKLQTSYSKANLIVPIVKRNITIKYVIFFILGLIILIFFWTLLSSFGAVYQNTQLIIFENTLISFGISFIYPFFFNIFPCFFRMCALNSKSECLYNFSKVLQIF